MHRTNPARWQHTHHYAPDSSVAERRTRIVIGITAAMMVVEIAGGIAFGSIALLADGWHMSTHVAAFLIAAMAYHFSRKHAKDARYSFGTGKMGVLGGFASAVVLAVIALLMDEPHHHGHAHGHEHGHDHGRGHGDLNLRAAYIHVLADALTSVTAIVALTAGKFLGWNWLDPVMGIVGSVIVSVWAYGLVRDTSGILLDRTPETSDLSDEIRRAVESDGDSIIADLHVWQVGTGKFAAIVRIVAHDPKPVETFRELFREHEELVHVTVEVRHCEEHKAPPATT